MRLGDICEGTVFEAGSRRYAVKEPKGEGAWSQAFVALRLDDNSSTTYILKVPKLDPKTYGWDETRKRLAKGYEDFQNQFSALERLAGRVTDPALQSQLTPQETPVNSVAHVIDIGQFTMEFD